MLATVAVAPVSKVPQTMSTTVSSHDHPFSVAILVKS